MDRTARTKKFRQLVNTGQDLFMRHGIRRVTVEEICSEANVSKMTFYKYFQNKIKFTKYLLERIFTEQMNDYRKIMVKQISYPDKVKQIIQLKQEQTNMMSQEFFHDLWKNPIPEVVELLERMTDESLNEVLNDFNVAKDNGEIRHDINTEFILYFMNKMTEMASDEHLLSLYSSHNDLIMELTNFFFYGILPVKEHAGA